MQLRRAKVWFAALWVFMAVVIGALVGVSSVWGILLLAGLGLLPPLVMLLRWNDPQETLSESIGRGRR
jgi:hypothetical protein